ncbi:MAG: ribonuclease P protein component [Pseudomonadota bacterium]
MLAGRTNGLVRTLKKRREFLAAAKARRCASPGLVLQVANRPDGEGLGVGFTASKKVGNAVSRNRAKRRMRALAADILPRLGRPGQNYVLIARQALLTRRFDDLRRDLEGCLLRIDRPRKAAR